jgi:hypothetical protein
LTTAQPGDRNKNGNKREKRQRQNMEKEEKETPFTVRTALAVQHQVALV